MGLKVAIVQRKPDRIGSVSRAIQARWNLNIDRDALRFVRLDRLRHCGAHRIPRLPPHHTERHAWIVIGILGWTRAIGSLHCRDPPLRTSLWPVTDLYSLGSYSGRSS